MCLQIRWREDTMFPVDAEELDDHQFFCFHRGREEKFLLTDAFWEFSVSVDAVKYVLKKKKAYEGDGEITRMNSWEYDEIQTITLQDALFRLSSSLESQLHPPLTFMWWATWRLWDESRSHHPRLHTQAFSSFTCFYMTTEADSGRCFEQRECESLLITINVNKTFICACR